MMSENNVSFGYSELIPENIRKVFMWLCQDVADLQSKWDFYLELFGNDENTALLTDLAAWSFNVVEDALRNDMTMAICRLADRSTTLGNSNLSMATLVENCATIDGLDTQLADFRSACAPITVWRNRRVGHRDFRTAIQPKVDPLPGVGKSHIQRILHVASRLLQTVSLHYGIGNLQFSIAAPGDAGSLIYWLRSGKEYRSRT